MPSLLGAFIGATVNTKGSASAAALIAIIIIIGWYIFVAWLLYRVGKRLGYEKCWLAWIPFASTWMLCKISGKDNPAVWFSWIMVLTIGSTIIRYTLYRNTARGFITSAILIATIILAIQLWRDISKRCGKPSWWGILYFIPLVGWWLKYKMGEVEPLAVQGQYYCYPPGYPQGYAPPPHSPTFTPLPSYGQPSSSQQLLYPPYPYGVNYSPPPIPQQKKGFSET